MRGPEQGLEAVSETFIALAQGPYRNSVGLLAQIYAFDETARRARSAPETVETLRHAERILLALRAAAARGDLTEERPPAAF